MIRIIPTSVHTAEDVDYTINAFTEVAHKLKTGAYPKEHPTGVQ